MIRIAMWSGPRNISTAMLRAWGNRADTMVCDEPLYAHYLQQTGFDHPGAAEVIATHETDWRRVVQWLTEDAPADKQVFYQKHMAHHLLPHLELDWMSDLTNCLLIRDPREMLTSLLEFLPEPTVFDTGLPQQVAIFSRMQSLGISPPVLDAKDVLQDPRGMLTVLCSRVGIGFDEAMLQWPPGLRETDGVWAKHWYDKVARTTGFARYRPKSEQVPSHLQDVLVHCQEYYQRLYPHRLRSES